MVAMQNYSNMPQAAYNTAPQYLPQQQSTPQANTPEASGVKINIYNPQANSGSREAQQQPSVYGMPQNSLYNMPTASAYAVPQGSVYNQPQVQAQPVTNTITPPPPAIDKQNAEQTEPIKLEQQPPAATPEPANAPAGGPNQPEKKSNAELNNQAPTSTVNVQNLNNSLKAQDPNQQSDAILKIAEVAQSNTPESNELLNEETFKGLSGVITKDNSQLQGPQKAKAEENKETGMYSLALLQNNMRNQMNAQSKQQGIPPMTIKDLPGVTDIVANVKNDPSPAVRSAGISALNFLAKPEDKEIVAPIYQQALNDQSPDVKNAAKLALSKFAQPEAAAQQAPKAEQKAPEKAA